MSHLLRQAEAEKLTNRLLLSGEDCWDLAESIATAVQGSNWVHDGDVLVITDDGTTIKVGEDEGDLRTMRGLTQWAHRTPRAGAWRVVMIENVERMTLNASNAFLKLLEEPPTRTRFILTTKNHHQLLATILSRVDIHCIPTDIRTGSDSLVLQFLNGNLADRLALVHSLDAEIKKAKTTGKWKEYMLDLLLGARMHAPEQLPRIWQSFRRLQQNANPRFVMEHLSLDLG